MTISTSTPKNQGPATDLRSEKLRKAQAIEAGLEAGARRRDVEIRIRARAHTVTPGSSFSYGRRNGLNTLLRHRHGLHCNTDDAIVWLETALPFVIDAAFRSGQSVYNDAVAWAERYVPDMAKDLGAAEIHRRVDSLMEMRSKPWRQWTTSTGRTNRTWLPSMEEMVASLQIRWEEVTACSLRGWGSINPPTKEQRLAHDRKRKAREREAKEVRPRSQMTKMTEAKAYAVEMDVNEKTIRRWRDSGTLEEKVARFRALRAQTSNDNDDPAG